MMEDEVNFKKALIGRLAPTGLLVAIAFIAFFVFRNPPTGGFSIAWPIVAVILLLLSVGYAVEATATPILLSLSTTGLKPNWFEEEIAWSNVISAELVEQKGFKFGGEFVRLRFVNPISPPQLYQNRFIGFETSFEDSGFAFSDWWRMRVKSKPIWQLVLPTEMLLNASSLDTTSAELVTLLGHHLKKKSGGV
jgi:hypothetical protein